MGNPFPFRYPCHAPEGSRDQDDHQVGIDMPDGILGKAQARLLDAEGEEPDHGDHKDDHVAEQQVVAGSLPVEIPAELDHSEDRDDQGKEDHRGHGEEAEEVGTAGEGCQDGRDLQGLRAGEFNRVGFGMGKVRPGTPGRRGWRRGPP